MKRYLLLALGLSLLNSASKAQQISPWLFGQNHWMAQSDEGNRPGYINLMWPKVAESGIEMVRIGGNGYEKRFPNQERLSAMIDSIRKAGAEPLLQIPRTYSASQAAQVVRENKYTKGKGARFYTIGNEPLLNQKNTIEEVYTYINRIAPAMKDVDPNIKIFIFDESSMMKEQYERVVDGDLDLTKKDAKGRYLIDGITFHSYPNGRDFNRDDVVFTGPYRIRKQTKELLEMIKKANQKNERTGDAQLLWGLTETNVTYMNPNREISGYGNPSFLGGQFIAEIYGIGLEYGAFTVDPWCISETDRVSSDFGYLGLPSEFFPRSSYYHTQMMAQNMKGKFLPSNSNNAYVKTIGTLSDSTICIMIMNENQTHDFEFDLILGQGGDSAKPLIIHTNLNLHKTISGTIPNQTTLMFVLSKTGEIKRRYTYGLSQNLKIQPPKLE